MSNCDRNCARESQRENHARPGRLARFRTTETESL